mmetsp:Transcript_101999/g.202508  ORF Transcript_101999/g.202508 Transcript_101999/m.202508 type:complete len:310 (+) Transcript_101999:86-1015(+)
MAADPAQTRSFMHEDLMQRGVPMREANRMAVRASLQQVVEASFSCLARVWLCVVLLLLVGMFAVLIWSQVVYAQHSSDSCDQPLALMLRIICAIVILQGLQRDIVRNCLCYDLARDGPVEPMRVRAFRILCLLSAVLWPVVACWMLLHTDKCNQDLKTAVEAIVCYYGALLVILVIAPAFFLTIVLCLVRRGWIRLPRSPAAAPEDLIERLPTLPYDAERFNDDAPSGYPTACPVCLDAFGEDRPITGTPCGHAFHTHCLGGWLQVARSCPLCRVDLTEDQAGSGGPPSAAVAPSADSDGTGDAAQSNV